jgi:hypothetical protein
MTGLGTIVANRSVPGSWMFPSTASIVSFSHMANLDGADSELYESVRLCSWEIILTDMTIQSGEKHLKAPYTDKLQL